MTVSGVSPRSNETIRADVAAWRAAPPGRTVEDRRRYLDIISARLVADVEPLLARAVEAEAVVRGLRSQLDWWEGWSNEVASLLPERYDGDEAQESIILRAVADLVAAETYWHAEAEKWMRMVVQCDGRIAALKAQDETEEDTVDARALLVIELRIADPSQIPNAIKAINPPTIPHFAGNVRVTMDAFGDDAADNPATAIINYLEGEGE